jgi:hypothetical protein
VPRTLTVSVFDRSKNFSRAEHNGKPEKNQVVFGLIILKNHSPLPLGEGWVRE